MISEKQGYTRRLTVDLDTQLSNRMQGIVPHGSMKPLIDSIFQSIVDLIDSVGEDNKHIVIGAIISKKISILDAMRNREI